MSKITDSDLITEDKVDFVLSEAKEQLNATVADAEALNEIRHLSPWRSINRHYRFSRRNRGAVQWDKIPF